MKRKTLAVMLLLCLVSLGSLNAQWARTYGGKYYDYAYSIQERKDGGYIVAGSTDSGYPGYYDFWILKLSKAGKIIWQKTYGGSSSDNAYSIQQTVDGGFIVVGCTSSFGAGSEDLWILKLDLYGNIEWQKTYGGSSDDSANSIQQTMDGGYIVAGYTSSSGAGSKDLWILKLNSRGKIEWQKTYGGSSDDSANSIRQTMDGGYIVAGYTSSSGEGSEDFWILRLDLYGDIEWQKTYGGSSDDSADSIQQTMDGGYIVTGGSKSFGKGADDFWVLKLSSRGEIEWQKTYGESKEDSPHSIIQATDGGYVAAGNSESFCSEKEDFWILKLSPRGIIEWQKTYGSEYSSDNSNCIQQTLDGCYIVAGNTYSFYGGAGSYSGRGSGSDVWLLKLLPNGNMSPLYPFIRNSNTTGSYTTIKPNKTNVLPQDTNIKPRRTLISPRVSNAVVYRLGLGKCKLTIPYSSGGTTEPASGTHTYNTGSKISLTATPIGNYNFSRWSENIETNINPVTIVMDGNKLIRASFYELAEWGGGDGDFDFGPGCFIATAAYGSPLDARVQLLRDFRDKYLMPSKLGRVLVDLYYKYSPPAAHLISKHKALKIFVRISLAPIVAGSYLLLHFGLMFTTIILVLILMLPISLTLFLQRKFKGPSFEFHKKIWTWFSQKLLEYHSKK